MLGMTGSILFLGIAGLGPAAGRSLFDPVPPGWNLNTIRTLYHWILSLPLRVPELIHYVMEQARLFGAIWTILLILFVVTVLYSLIGRKRLHQKLEKELQPLWNRLPAQTSPRLLAFIRVVVSPLLPLLFLGLFLLIQGVIRYEVPWFTLVNKLLTLWAGAALVMSFLRESLTDGLLPFCPLYGRTLFRAGSVVIIYIMAAMAVVWVVEAIHAPKDVLAFIRFAASLTIVCVTSSLLLRKEELLSLLPPLPDRSYAKFTRFIERVYLPLALLTFIAGLLWCLGYRRLCDAILTKTWGVALTYIAIMLIYHFLSKHLRQWSEKKEHLEDKTTEFLFRSARAFLRYGTTVIAALLILKLLGFLTLLHDVMALPIYTIGEMPISVLVLMEAGLILFAFVYAYKLAQAYLDHKIYPSMGIDTGLGYALDTFLKYLFIAIGSLSALRIMGLDLRVLMVFAGGIGIGAGFGLQHVAGNIVSGFILVFGRKVRKGDWIKVEDKLGMVTQVYLRATKIWTRENIEFLVPNNDLVSKTTVNYTLTSPIVRISVPVGVSYEADPLKVRKVLMECTEKHDMATQFRKPEVRIVGFGDSSVNFEILIWIDISRIAEKDIRSRIYFTIFEAFADAGITIPFPQRDIHIRN